MSRGLAGCWLFNEADGDIACDLSGNGHSGTKYGDVIWKADIYGSALDFGHDVDRVICAGAAKILNPDEGTIEMLVRPHFDLAGAATYYYFFDTYGGSNSRFLLNVDIYSDLLTLYTDTVNRGNFDISGFWTAETLYHIVLVWGTNKLYINGELVHTYDPGGLGDGADNLYIGDRYTTGSRAFDGKISYCRIWNRALMSSEISKLYLDPFCMFEYPWTPKIAVGVVPPAIAPIFISTITDLWTIKQNNGLFTKI